MAEKPGAGEQSGQPAESPLPDPSKPSKGFRSSIIVQAIVTASTILAAIVTAAAAIVAAIIRNTN